MKIPEVRLKFFAHYIESKTGIQYSEANYYQLEHRLSTIATQLGFRDLEELWQRSQEGISGSFQDLLLDLATNNETSFFRDSGVFKALHDTIIPEILPHVGVQGLRFWSAASSTGQEVYSLAMNLEESHSQNSSFPSYSILATDISDRVLARAKEGVYSQLEVQRGVPARFLVKYFKKNEDSSWAISDSLKSHLRFKRVNLIEPWGPMGTFDIVLCRNVLIYQNVENKRAVVERIYQLLAPHGVLLLGAAESMLGVSERFKQVHAPGAVYYRKIE